MMPVFLQAINGPKCNSVNDRKVVLITAIVEIEYKSQQNMMKKEKQ